MIQRTTSVGLMGLPHFKTSRAAMELYEPIYKNLFTVEIAFPTMLGLTQAESNLVIEGIKKVGGLNTNKVPDAGTSQNYKFATRRFANSGPSETTLDVSFDFEVNLQGCETGRPNMYTIKNLRRWTDLIYDPLTGRQGLKKDYVAPSITITMHLRNGQPYYQFIGYYIFPTTGAPAPTLDYNSTTLMSGAMTFRCDWWDECIL